MSRAVLGAMGVLLFATFARAEVVVELVPDNPGPYSGGETLTVDVWLHSEVDYWAWLRHVQFDFIVSDPQLSFDANFTFDYSTLRQPHGYDYGSPAMPVPWTYNGWENSGAPAYADDFMGIPPGGSFHVGSIGVQLPAESGEYRLDVVDAEQVYKGLGVLLGLVDSPFWPDPVWRAHTGEITGGTYDFTVRVVPAVSDWALVVLALLLLTVGTIALTHREQIRAGHTCALAPLREMRAPSRRSAPRQTGRVSRMSLGFLLPILWSVVVTHAADPPPDPVEINLDSGNISASGAGTEPVVVFSEVVTVADVFWMRFHFEQVVLSGSPDRAP